MGGSHSSKGLKTEFPNPKVGCNYRKEKPGVWVGRVAFKHLGQLFISKVALSRKDQILNSKQFITHIDTHS